MSARPPSGPAPQLADCRSTTLQLGFWHQCVNKLPMHTWVLYYMWRFFLFFFIFEQFLQQLRRQLETCCRCSNGEMWSDDKGQLCVLASPDTTPWPHCSTPATVDFKGPLIRGGRPETVTTLTTQVDSGTFKDSVDPTRGTGKSSSIVLRFRYCYHKSDRVSVSCHLCSNILE